MTKMRTKQNTLENLDAVLVHLLVDEAILTDALRQLDGAVPLNTVSELFSAHGQLGIGIAKVSELLLNRAD